MPPDEPRVPGDDRRSDVLTNAARGKHERCVANARAAIKAMDDEGVPISFPAVSRRAGVSRQWLYTEPEVRAEIEGLRDLQGAGGRQRPVRERASDNSLRTRNRTLLEENGRLRDEISVLREELAVVHGELRAARQTPKRPAA